MRTWLVNANEDLCDHVGAFARLGFISWKERDNAHIALGDIVYVFVSHTRNDGIRYKTRVSAINEERRDLDYWHHQWRNVVEGDSCLRLTKFEEYRINERLSLESLVDYGFKGLRAIQSPKCLDHDPNLFNYINHTCSDMKNLNNAGF